MVGEISGGLEKLKSIDGLTPPMVSERNDVDGSNDVEVAMPLLLSSQKALLEGFGGAKEVACMELETLGESQLKSTFGESKAEDGISTSILLD
jgi:hypothetical protein